MCERDVLISAFKRLGVRWQGDQNSIEIGNHIYEEGEQDHEGGGRRITGMYSTQWGSSAEFTFDDAGQLVRLELSTGE